jgi:glucose/arabinose dehydrogenase
MPSKYIRLALLPFAVFIIGSTIAQPSLSYRKVISGLSGPLEITGSPDGSGRLFVVQKVGSVKVFDRSFNYLSDLVTVPGININGERGLLSMTFHPNFRTNGFFFVYYTTSLGDIEISRYTIGTNPNKADTTTRKIIITIPHRVAANHNGGKMAFGPDGYLYFATGDGGNGGDPPNNAQNGRVLLGKMIRIDVDHDNPPFNYSIPADNPFVNDTTIADEIWSLGLRNPFRWSFDRRTYDMWIGDVGQGVREEINFRKAGTSKGVNYGWRCYEGKNVYNLAGCKAADQYTAPIFDYPHNLTTGGSSVTGGYVYRGSEYPALNGYYIFTDYISNNQWMINDSSGTWVIKQQAGTFPRNIVGYGEAEDGSLYACSITENVVYKVEATTPVKVGFLQLTGIARYSIAQLTWRTTEQNLSRYEVESSDDSIHFVQVASITALNKTPDNSYRFTDNIRGHQKKYYRLRIVNSNGNWDYSRTVVVNNLSAPVNIVYPSVIRNNTVNFYISDAYDQLLLFNTNGTVLANRSVRGLKGRFDINLPNLPKGMYLIKLSNSRTYVTQWVYLQ